PVCRWGARVGQGWRSMRSVFWYGESEDTRVLAAGLGIRLRLASFNAGWSASSSGFGYQHGVASYPPAPDKVRVGPRGASYASSGRTTGAVPPWGRPRYTDLGIVGGALLRHRHRPDVTMLTRGLTGGPA